MKVDVFCASAVRDGEHFSQMGGCGVVLIATDDHNRVQCREFSYGLGGSSLILCDIQASRIALASIAPGMRSELVTIFTESMEVADLLTSTRESHKFIHQTAELRRWGSYYKDLSVNVVTNVIGHMARAKELAIVGLNKQRNSDSGTFLMYGG